MKNKHTPGGFTLIELLIVIVVVGILAAGAYVALDPGTRFADSRDSTRWTDVSAILDSVKVDQVDNKGSYVAAVGALTDGTIYMIGTGASGAAACADQTIVDTNLVDISALDSTDEGYIASIPVAPQASGGTARTAAASGYYMISSSTGTIEVGACDSENATTISVSR